MENLEKYIKENIEQADNYDIPQGHKERFIAKIAEQDKIHTNGRLEATWWNSKYIFGACSAAAVILIALFISIGYTPAEERYKIEVQELAYEMYMEESSLLQLFTEEQQHMINSIKTITEEAVPLAEQLPAELPAKERAKILREYYKTKTANLRQIKTLFAAVEEPID